ncbi:MAG: FAD/FMN-containing dehydrogenase [Myxococcota bacterium]
MKAVLATLLLLLPSLAASEAHLEGSLLEPFTLRDQHGLLHEVDESVHAILFSREMEGGKIIKQTLSEDGAALLERARAVYVSDISGMPALIRKIFALPRMRRRPYPMLLDTDGSVTERFPASKGHATLLVLDKLHIEKIAHLDSPAALTAELEKLAAETPESEPDPEPSD